MVLKVYSEKKIKFKLIEKNINSMQRSIIKKLCLFQIIPNKPITNKKKEKFKQTIKGTEYQPIIRKDKITIFNEYLLHR
jgi:hypothetical protein